MGPGADLNPSVSVGLWSGGTFPGKDFPPYILAQVLGGIAGAALLLVILISIPVTKTSVNPARSTGVALFAGGWAVAQLWLSWVAPIARGILGGLVYRFRSRPEE